MRTNQVEKNCTTCVRNPDKCFWKKNDMCRIDRRDRWVIRPSLKQNDLKRHREDILLYLANFCFPRSGPTCGDWECAFFGEARRVVGTDFVFFEPMKDDADWRVMRESFDKAGVSIYWDFETGKWAAMVHRMAISIFPGLDDEDLIFLRSFRYDDIRQLGNSAYFYIASKSIDEEKTRP